MQTVVVSFRWFKGFKAATFLTNGKYPLIRILPVFFDQFLIRINLEIKFNYTYLWNWLIQMRILNLLSPYFPKG